MTLSLQDQGSVYIIVPQSTLSFGSGDTPDYVVIADGPYNRISGSFSMDVWVKPTDWGNPAGLGRIFNKLDKNGNAGYGLFMSGQAISPTNSKYLFRVSGGATDTVFWWAVYSTSPVSFNTWTHLAGTYDRVTQTQSIYINGELENSNTSTKGPCIWDGGNLYFGSYATSRSLSGQICSAHLFSGVCLSPNEVKQLYYGTYDNRHKCVGNYEFIDREGTKLTDSSLYNQSGALKNGPTWTNRSLRCWCTNWDENNYNISLELMMDPIDRSFLMKNVVPGAIRDLFTVLGETTYIDTTYSSGNTLILEPISGYGISSIRKRERIGVKSIKDEFINRDLFSVRIEGIKLD